MNKRWFATPYLIWMVIFTIVPLFLIIFYAFTVKTDAGFVFSLEPFIRSLEPTYLKVIGRSVLLALISTIICLILGYPIAMILTSKAFSQKSIYLMLFVIPMWMNFLLRTYAWLTLLEKNGFINVFLRKIGLNPLNLLYTNQAVVLGMVYNFLPFMVLPIYSVLKKLDFSLIESAQDLGANSVEVFTKVIFPLSIPGVVSGITMVFMPAVTTFVISRLLGGGHFFLIGNLIEDQFLTAGNWHFGSALSVVLMLLIIISMLITSKYDTDKEGSVGLW
ncbi:MAG: ABC transporter permease [Epulopiscium sp.]|nr:ABC transporter permease [Candidatus Epulonipiscium sp.]